MQSNRIKPDKFTMYLPGANGHLPGNLKVSDICYVGSHNSGCSKVFFLLERMKHYGWIYAQQRHSLTKQIEHDGARYFKIPLHWFDSQSGCCGCLNSNNNGSGIPYIAIAHEDDGKSNCRLSILQRGFSFPKRAIIIFEEIANAAKKYPKEIFILKVETYLMSGRTSANHSAQFTKQIVTDFFDELLTLSGLRELAYPWVNFQEIPCLNDLRQGKNVIILSDDKDFMTDNIQLTNSHTFYAYNYLCQTNWSDNPLTSTFSKELIRVSKDEQGNILEPFFEAHFNPQASLSITSYAYLYNAYEHVLTRFKALTKFYKKQVNFVASDYIDQGHLSRVVDEINQDIMNIHTIQTAQTMLRQMSPISLLFAEYGCDQIDIKGDDERDLIKG